MGLRILSDVIHRIDRVTAAALCCLLYNSADAAHDSSGHFHTRTVCNHFYNDSTT